MAFAARGRFTGAGRIPIHQPVFRGTVVSLPVRLLRIGLALGTDLVDTDCGILGTSTGSADGVGRANRLDARDGVDRTCRGDLRSRRRLGLSRRPEPALRWRKRVSLTHYGNHAGRP